MIRLILGYTFRSIRRNVFYHLINIFGLIIAFTSVFYILLWINQEMSYDNYHPSGERIHRFSLEYQQGDHHTHFARVWQRWTVDMPGYFPEIEEMCRLQTMRKGRLKIGREKYTNFHFFLVDSNYFDFFGNRLLKGNPETILKEPNTLVISERLATKYFGEEDPIGKEVLAAHQFDTSYHSFTVTGIMEDPRLNSHFKIDLLAPIDYTDEDPGWAYIYLRLIDENSPTGIIEKFPGFLAEHMDEETIAALTPHLQPLQDIHLKSDKDREIEANNKQRSVYLFAAVGLIFLLIVFVNNANLNIAMINSKMRFFFLNRVNGAHFRDIARFVGLETGLVYALSIILALVIILASQGGFERYFGYDIQAGFSGVWIQISLLALILCSLGIFFGLLPILMLSIKERIHLLSGRIFYHTGFDVLSSRRGLTGRKILIIAQFSGSLVLVLFTLFSFLQIRYMLKEGIGSGEDNIIVLSNLPRPALDKYEVFKNELLKDARIMEVSASMEEPSKMLMDAMHFEMEGMDESLKNEFIGVFPVDDNFMEFYDLELIAGSGFPAYAGMEAREHYIINESALKILKLENPQDAIGLPFKLVFGWDIFKGGTIIGVAEDFHFYTMKEAIKPMVMFQKHIWFWNFLIRVNESDFAGSLDFIEKTWNTMYPDYPFEYTYVDDLYTSIYSNEIIQMKILGVIALLTMIIACLGLVGLIHYLAAARTREIGIRKVNGASRFRILYLLNREFIIMILLAQAAGIPVAWIMVRSWLQNYVYHIDMDVWIPVVTGILFLLVSLLTVSYQSWMAASKNPVQSLRFE